jgi:hypothetical protein
MEEEELQKSLLKNDIKNERKEIKLNSMNKNEDVIDDLLTKRKYGRGSDITQDIRFIAGLDDFRLGISKFGLEENDDREEVNVDVKKDNNITTHHVSTEVNDPEVEKLI